MSQSQTVLIDIKPDEVLIFAPNGTATVVTDRIMFASRFVAEVHGLDYQIGQIEGMMKRNPGDMPFLELVKNSYETARAALIKVCGT